MNWRLLCSYCIVLIHVRVIDPKKRYHFLNFLLIMLTLSEKKVLVEVAYNWPQQKQNKAKIECQSKPMPRARTITKNNVAGESVGFTYI